MTSDTTTPAPGRVVLTEEEAAAYLHARTGLHWTADMVKRRRLAGKIRGERLSRAYSYRPAELDRFLEPAA